MDTNKTVPVINIPPVRFIGSPTKQVIKGNIKEAWYTEIFLAVTTTVGVPVGEALTDVGMNSRKVLMHMECGRKGSWVKVLREVCPTQSVDQWIY